MKHLDRLLLCALLVAGLMQPVLVSQANQSRMNTQAVYLLLQSGDNEMVRALAAGDREILLAVIAMNQGETKKALLALSADAVKKNRLAALIRAEAYRRQSVQAAERAGHYAHAANADIGRLKQARISAGLDEANQRLQALMASLNAAQVNLPEPAELQLELQTDLQADLQTDLQPVVVSASLSKAQLLESVEFQAIKFPLKTRWPSIVVRPAHVIETAAMEAKLSTASASKTASLPSVKRQVKKPAKVMRAKTKPAVSKKTTARIKSVRKSLERWRKDWESRTSSAYLKHYHKAFKTPKYDYKSWRTYKRRVNAKKSYIKVGLSQLKISPSSRFKQWGEAVQVTFKQRYQSSNFSANSHKKLYMVRQRVGDPWLILREE